MDAVERGDYDTALKEWRPLAEQGDATAQRNVGRMHFEGLGVPQDYREAAKWFRLAAEQGICTGPE
ncbi:MAG: sel1 repeat family protein [Nitrospinae bacterium]|nr:sel1 repeat family protein [Nitrospinota bacterium]